MAGGTGGGVCMCAGIQVYRCALCRVCMVCRCVGVYVSAGVNVYRCKDIQVCEAVRLCVGV